MKSDKLARFILRFELCQAPISIRLLQKSMHNIELSSRPEQWPGHSVHSRCSNTSAPHHGGLLQRFVTSPSDDGGAARTAPPPHQTSFRLYIPRSAECTSTVTFVRPFSTLPSMDQLGAFGHKLSPCRPAIMFTHAVLTHLFAPACTLSSHDYCSNWAQGSLGGDAPMNQPLVGSCRHPPIQA